MQGGNPLEAGERPLGAGPTAGGGRVTFLVSAFDRASGRKAWEYELPAEGPLPSVHEKHNLASPSPVTDGERVYAWFGTGQIAAVDLRGKLVWKKHLGAEYRPVRDQLGPRQLAGRPSRHAHAALLSRERRRTCSRSTRARARCDGRSMPIAGVTSYSTPLVVETGGRTEIIVNSSAGVSGHDVATGRRLWHIDEANRFPIPTPLVHDGVIYTSRGYRSSPFMAIRPGGSGDVSASHVAWRVPSGAPYISSLVHYDGLIYMVGDVGVLTVTDARTGERVHQERIGGVYTASPVAADGKVYLASEDGETIVLAAGRYAADPRAQQAHARQLASPAIVSRAAVHSIRRRAVCDRAMSDALKTAVATGS